MKSSCRGKKHSCLNKRSRLCLRHISDDQWRRLHRRHKFSFKAMAEELGCSRGAVRVHANRLGLRRIRVHDLYSKAQWEDMIRTHVSTWAIARKIGWSRWTVFLALHHHGLCTTRRTTNDVPTEMFQALYDKHRNVAGVAKALGFNADVTGVAMRKRGIRNKREKYPWTWEALHELHVVRRYGARAIGKLYGASDRAVAHAFKRYGIPKQHLEAGGRAIAHARTISMPEPVFDDDDSFIASPMQNGKS